MEMERCPCCSNHCNSNKLKCKKGRKYFSREREGESGQAEETLSGEREIVHACKKLLRKCAKLARNGETEELLGKLTEEETQTLCALLKKCLK